MADPEMIASRHAQAFAARCRRVALDPIATRALRAPGRRINPEALDAERVAFGAPTDARPLKGMAARMAAGRLLAPMYDAQGVLRGFRARARDLGPAWEGGPKSVAVGASLGLVLANAWGRRLLQGLDAPEPGAVVVVVEGESDLWAWVTLGTRRPVLGVVSGSSTPELAARLPPSARVALRLDQDAGGDALALAFARACFEAGRDDVVLMRLRGVEGDEGTRLARGALQDAPLDGCVPYQPTPEELDPTSKAEALAEDLVAGRRPVRAAYRDDEQALEAVARGIFKRKLDEARCAGRGGRALAFDAAAYTAGGLVAASYLSRAEVERELTALASDVWSGKGDGADRRQAVGRIRRGLMCGARSPIELRARDIDLADRAIAERARRRARDTSKKPARDLRQARCETNRAVLDALERGGATVVIAPPGVGKSHAARELVVERVKAGAGDVEVALPTRDLADEQLEDYLRELDGSGHDAARITTRTPKNCMRFAEVVAAERVAAGGGSRYCQRCPLHPTHVAGGETQCEFWLDLWLSEGASVLLSTHAATASAAPLDLAGTRVRIDWASLETAGEAAAPLIELRGGEVVIHAVDAPRGEGSAPPRVERADTPPMDSASKRDLVGWFCERLGLEVEEDAPADARLEAVRERVRSLAGAPDTPVRVAWSELAAAFEAGRWQRFMPAWGPTSGASLKLTVTRASEAEGGEVLPLVERQARGGVCARSRQAAEAWLAGRLDAASTAREDIEAAARAKIERRPLQARLIDESPLDAYRRGGELTAAHVAELVSAGELRGRADAVQRLLRLMREAEQRGRGFRPQELRARLDPGALELEHGERAAALIDDVAGSEGGREARVARLAEAPPFDAVEGLRLALGDGWRGARVTRRGTIAAAHLRRVDVERAGATIGLDATATPTLARALFGDSVHVTRVELDKPAGQRVVWVPLETGPRSHVFGETPGSMIAAAAWVGARLRYDSEATLHVSHKAELEARRGASALFDALEGDVLHHGGTRARGSNEYRAHSIAVLDAYHVPGGAVSTDAELLARALDQDADEPETREALEAEARFQLEAAPAIQAAHRIRLNEASASAPKTIVCLDPRSPERFGFEVDELVQPAVLAWEETGHVSHHAARAIIERLIASTGGMYAPTVAAEIGAPDLEEILDERQKRGRAVCEGLFSNLQRDPSAPSRSTLHTRISGWVERHFGGNWKAAARAWGCAVALVQTDRGGRPIPILYAGPELDRYTLARWLVHRGAERYQVEGDAAWTLIERSPLARALTSTPEATITGATLAELYCYIGLHTGQAASTVRAMIGRIRAPEEDNRACIVRLWHDTVARAQAEAREEIATIAAVRDGLSEHEALVAAAGALRESWPARPRPWRLQSMAWAIGGDEDVEPVRRDLAALGVRVE